MPYLLQLALIGREFSDRSPPLWSSAWCLVPLPRFARLRGYRPTYPLSILSGDEDDGDNPAAESNGFAVQRRSSPPFAHP
jgi:hypothetical protein